MVNRKFEVYKVKREIKQSGTTFTFWRFPKNAFGEVDTDKEPEYLCMVRGIYHEFTAHMTDTIVLLTGSETAIVRSKKTPQCLCEYDSILFTHRMLSYLLVFFHFSTTHFQLQLALCICGSTTVDSTYRGLTILGYDIITESFKKQNLNLRTLKINMIKITIEL